MPSENCPICYETFNRTLNIPYLLPCGHTFCEKCLYSVKAICPACRRAFTHKSKNHILLEVMEAHLESQRNIEKCQVHNFDIYKYCRACKKRMCGECRCEHLNSDKILFEKDLREKAKEA